MLKTISFALKNNPKLFKKYFFQFFLYLYENSLIQQQNCFAYYQHILMINILHVYLLKKIGNEYLPNHKFLHVLIYNLDHLFFNNISQINDFF